jgi:hypothetical protein
MTSGAVVSTDCIGKSFTWQVPSAICAHRPDRTPCGHKSSRRTQDRPTWPSPSRQNSAGRRFLYASDFQSCSFRTLCDSAYPGDEVARRESSHSGAKNPASRLAIPDPAADTRLGLTAIVDSATRAPIPASHKGITEAAIHTARGDKARLTQTSGCEFLCHCSDLNQMPL